MFAHLRRPYSVVAAFSASLFLLSVQQGTSETVPGQNTAAGYDAAVSIPTVDKKLDQRPFFSTRRHPTIEYSDRPSTDVVGELKRKVEEGLVTLRYEGNAGYLPSVLEALQVPVESQTVVFSKTSLQSHYISPSNPRSIYFTDDITVAFIRTAPLLEIAALDPTQGVVFYAVPQIKSDKPRILRSDSCLSCHETQESMGVPGLLMRSVATGTGGEALPELKQFFPDHRTPFEERWGGWFITGTTGSMRHMGNATVPPNATAAAPAAVTPPLATLQGKFDLDGYSGSYSDVAAVLALNHQVRMINLLTRVGWEARIAINQAANDPQSKEAAARLIAANAQELVDYLLFVDEAPLPARLESTSGFPAKFNAMGPSDKQGRSLRQLDLEKRLLRYPCSYMIYSPAFDGLPGAAKDAVYSRMWEVLSGQEKDARYSKLTADLRGAIVGILKETKPGLPAYFR